MCVYRPTSSEVRIRTRRGSIYICQWTRWNRYSNTQIPRPQHVIGNQEAETLTNIGNDVTVTSRRWFSTALWRGGNEITLGRAAGGMKNCISRANVIREYDNTATQSVRAGCIATQQQIVFVIIHLFNALLDQCPASGQGLVHNDRSGL